MDLGGRIYVVTKSGDRLDVIGTDDDPMTRTTTITVSDPMTVDEKYAIKEQLVKEELLEFEAGILKLLNIFSKNTGRTIANIDDILYQEHISGLGTARKIVAIKMKTELGTD